MIRVAASAVAAGSNSRRTSVSSSRVSPCSSSTAHTDAFQQQPRLQAGHVGAVAAAYLQDPCGDQRLDRLAHDVAADAQFGGELLLRRQLRPRRSSPDWMSSRMRVMALSVSDIGGPSEIVRLGRQFPRRGVQTSHGRRDPIRGRSHTMVSRMPRISCDTSSPIMRQSVVDTRRQSHLRTRRSHGRGELEESSP